MGTSINTAALPEGQPTVDVQQMDAVPVDAELEKLKSELDEL
jgi:hypothetical protein